jgi:hypothetical protein
MRVADQNHEAQLLFWLAGAAGFEPLHQVFVSDCARRGYTGWEQFPLLLQFFDPTGSRRRPNGSRGIAAVRFPWLAM